MLTWLSAAVAFSLAMIVFSTIVSALTEVVHRLFHMRESGLRRMLEQLYEQHLAPRILGETAANGKAFADELTKNLAFPSTEAKPFRHWFAPRRLQSLDWLEFVRRVAETDVGAALRQRAKPELDRIVNEMAVRFERFGADASAYFDQRARAISILLAMVVALALNVDAARLFSTFLQDRALTEDFIARADRIVDEYQRGGDVPPEDVVAATRRLREAAASPLLAGLPIGFGVYPYCNAGIDAADPRCASGFLEKPLTALSWILSVLAAGFLIGLGGPFWFRAYSKLASILGSVRASSRRGEDEGSGEAAAPPDRAPPPEMRLPPVEAFLTSLPTASAPRARRVLFGRDGRRLA